MSDKEYDTKLNFLREQYDRKANIDRSISAAISAKNYPKVKEFSASRAVYQRNITDMAEEIFHETFRRKNSGLNTFQHIDLHELRLAEALVMVEHSIRLIREAVDRGDTERLDLKGGFAYLNIVTGRGNHSQHGAVLKP